MTPADLNLPVKFKEFREPQLRKLEDLFGVDVRTNACNLPTGFGKTSFYVAYSRLLSELRNRPIRTVINTATKALQQQIWDDFSMMGLADVRGRNNYSCPMYGNCDNGYEHECHLSTTLGCKYTKHVDVASRSELISTNYAYWMSARSNNPAALEPTNSDGAYPIDLLICDEAHQAFEELARHVSVHIPYEYCGGFPFDGESVITSEERLDAIRLWSVVRGKEVRQSQTEYENQAGYKKNPDWVALERIRKEFMKVYRLNKDWVYRLHDRRPGGDGASGLDFDCIWPAPYASRLWSGVPKILLVSGTLTPYSVELLGVNVKNENETYYTSEKSTFPANRYPIIHIPTVRLNYESTDADYARVISTMDEIIEARLDRKGIIQPVSYARGERALESSRYKHLMLSNKSSRTITDTVRQFKLADPPSILVSPSVSTGFDFPDEDAEYMIILKVPYPNRSDILMKARCDSDRRYYMHSTVQTLVQMCGRGMRHEQDRCETFILDDSVSMLKVVGSKFAPPGFFDSPRFRVSAKVPKPPLKLVWV